MLLLYISDDEQSFSRLEAEFVSSVEVASQDVMVRDQGDARSDREETGYK